MPEMDGIEVCERMKADKILRFIPVIMQTAANRPSEISEGIKAGVFLLSHQTSCSRNASFNCFLRGQAG